MRRCGLLLALLLLPAAGAAGADQLLLRVDRFRMGDAATSPDGYLAFVDFHTDALVGLTDVDLNGPGGVVLVSGGEVESDVGGLYPYANERVMAFDGSDFFLRLFGSGAPESCPLPDGVYTAEQASAQISAQTTLAGAFPEWPTVSWPPAEAEVPTQFTVLVDPPSIVPDTTRLLVVESKKGAFVFPPLYTYTVPGLATALPVPPGLLEPKRHYFLVAAWRLGSKGSATVVPVRTVVGDGLLDSQVSVAATVEKAGGITHFVRKGALPSSLWADVVGGAAAVVVRVGSLPEVVVPLKRFHHKKAKVHPAAVAQIDVLKLDFKKGKFKVRGRVKDPNRLGTDEDVLLRVQ